MSMPFLVKDIRTGSGGSFPGYLTVVGDSLFFNANDGINGYELWKSDGTTEGTVLVKDINSGTGSSYPRYLTAVGDALFFSANDGINGYELWALDVSEAPSFNVINGGAGNDVLTGMNGQNNFIDGGGGRNIITGGDLNDIIIGGPGADILTGGGGADIFRYNSLVDIGDTITDFEVGIDKIDLSELLSGINYSGSNPIDDSYVKFRSLGSDTIVQIDPDGIGSARALNFIRLQNVSADLMNNPDNFIF